jgi:hypothetical protein
MDLAGPKIRTGSMGVKVRPLKIAVPKDVYGRPLKLVEGFLDSESKFTEKVYLSGVQPSFVISIRRGSEHLANLNVGEKLWFRDTRWRYRTILERISPTRVKIGLDKTTYLQEGIVIHRQRFKETSIVPSRVRREDNTDENHINDTTGHTIDLSRDSGDYSNHDKVDDSQSDGKSGEDDSVVLGSLRLQPIIVRVKSGDIVLLQKNKAVSTSRAPCIHR